jgi:hypothetical protein
MGIEEVVVTIAPDGSVSVATSGFTGLACTSATAALESLMGNEVLDRTLTDEAYVSGDVGTQQDVGHSGESGNW